MPSLGLGLGLNRAGGKMLRFGIADDNALTDELGTDVSGWTDSNSTYVQGAEFATFSVVSAPSGTGVSTKTPFDSSGGDHIYYIKASADDVSGSAVQFGLRTSAGASNAIIGFGYNWATTSYEQQRISLGVRFGGSLVGVAGPSIDFSAAPVTLAVVYNHSHTSFSLYVLENDLWKFYGGVVTDSPAIEQLSISTGGGHTAKAYVYYLLDARPNIVSTGSSICAGHNSFDPDPDFYVGLDVYNSQYQYSLPTTLYPDLRNTLVFNSGVGSEDTAELLIRLPSVIASSEARLYLMGANLNDYGSGFTLQQRTDNLTDAIALVVADGETPVMVNEVYPDGANGVYYKEWWDDYRTQTGARKYINTMVPLFADGEDYIDPAYVTDGVHPNTTGYQLMGEYVRDHLRT